MVIGGHLAAREVVAQGGPRLVGVHHRAARTRDRRPRRTPRRRSHASEAAPRRPSSPARHRPRRPRAARRRRRRSAACDSSAAGWQTAWLSFRGVLSGRPQRGREISAQILRVTLGTSTLRRPSSSSPAHSGVPGRTTVPLPRRVAHEGRPAPPRVRPPCAAGPRRAAPRSARTRGTRRTARPRPGTGPGRPAARAAAPRDRCGRSRCARRTGRPAARGLGLRSSGPTSATVRLSELAAERDRPQAALLDLLAQAVAHPARQPDGAAGDRHARRVAERRAATAGERQVGGDVIGQPLAVEEAQQRRDLGGEPRRQARPRGTGARRGSSVRR